MSDNNSDRFSLSRRKAIAGIGSMGAAAALGGVGTYAQFSDTEEKAVTFTAGGIDGELTWSGSYNGDGVSDSLENVNVGGFSTAQNNPGEPQGVSVDVHFQDVKPGDYGCVNFGITVENNPAWVASCLNIEEDIDGVAYEPEDEVEANDNGTYVQNGDENPVPKVDYGADDGFSQTSEKDLYGSKGIGELAENMLVMPYYDSDGTCTFFDGGEIDAPETLPEQISTPTGFWSNSQEGDGWMGNSFETDDGEEYYLVPRTLRGANTVSAVDTAHWRMGESDTLDVEPAPDGASVGDGCVMLDGDEFDGGDTQNNTQGVSPLPPGESLNFGYDFHLPFGTGNEAQGDQLTLTLDFVFLQTRHTEAPDFGDYSPGSNA